MASTPARFLPAPRPQPTPAELFRKQQEELALAELQKRQKDERVLPTQASDSTFVRRYLGALDQSKQAQDAALVAQAEETRKAEVYVDKKKVARRMFGSFSRYGDLGFDDIESVGATRAAAAYGDARSVLGPADESLEELNAAYEAGLMAMVQRRRMAMYLLRWRVASKSRHRRRKIAELVALASAPVQRSPHAAVMELVATTTAKQPLHHRRNRRSPSVFEKDKGGLDGALGGGSASGNLASPRKPHRPGTRPAYPTAGSGPAGSEAEPPKSPCSEEVPVLAAPQVLPPKKQLVRKASKEIVPPGAPVPRAWALERHASRGDVVRRAGPPKQLRSSPSSEESKQADSPPPPSGSAPALTLLVHPVKTRMASPSVVRTCDTPTEESSDPRWLPPSLAHKAQQQATSAATRPRLNMARPGGPALRRRSSLLQASTAAYLAAQSPRGEDPAEPAPPPSPALAAIEEDRPGGSARTLEGPERPAVQDVKPTHVLAKRKKTSLVRLFFASLLHAVSLSTQLVARKPAGHPDARADPALLPKPRRRPKQVLSSEGVETKIPAST